MPDPNPPQKQEGGFMMSDKSNPGTLYSIMATHFNKPDNKTFFNSVLKQTDKAPDNNISFLDTPDYKEIYTKLINIIMTDEVYTQTFSDDGGKPFFRQAGMHNYHIQLCALMTMSFLFELEAFSVVHNYIRINIGTAENNRLPSIFPKSVSTPPIRQYNGLITNGIDEMLNYFTQSLDVFFNDFMNFLVDEIYTRINLGKLIFSKKEELIQEIVPVNSKTPKHVNGTFDFIYVDWKDRIKSKIKNTLRIGDADYTAGKYSRRINNAIEQALYSVEDGGSKYIAEGTGFFSFLYLLPKPGVKKKYNGSCITYSMLELYIMARLHVHANNLNLDIESEGFPEPHRFWKSVQADKNINLTSVSHWTTRYNFQSKPLHFRHADRFLKEIDTKHSFNFLDPDKPKLCLLLLYPIFDSYIQYIGQPDSWTKPSRKENAHIDKILPFIRKRIEFVKTLFTTHKTVSKHVSEHSVRGRVTGTEVKVSVPPILENWFTQVFGFDEKSFATNKGSFNVKNSGTNDHILMTVKKEEDIDIGVFRYVSVAELLNNATNNPSARDVFGFDRNNLKYFTMTSPAHVVHMTPGYSGSIFQVASQFNALEMVDPTRTPQQGITNYWNDKTQGPVCAMVCPFGTLYRNYFCMPADGKQPEDKSVNVNPQIGTATGGTGSGNNQINTLTELMNVDCFKALRFQNGYIFVKDKTHLDTINKYLSTPENFWKAMMAIKYVIQEDTPVVDVTTGDGKILDQIVSQIYCSAYPVAYSTDSNPVTGATPRVPGTTRNDYVLLSSMILHAVYYSTLAYAVTRITPDETRKKVFLTKVGGGVFGNEVSLIDNAIYNAVRHFTAYPIDVYIVEYKDADTIVDPEVKPLTSVVAFPYPIIQAALEKRATDETETVKNATDEKVAADRLVADKEKAEKAAAVEKAEKKHLILKDAIDLAIKNFSDKLKDTGADADDKKYAGILDELSGKIGNVRIKIDATLLPKIKPVTKRKEKGKKLEPKLGSKQMDNDGVKTFIDNHSDAIFVVTGGSFNPPHNGHIGMFQKAYDELIKKFPVKKVYGVMVPASEVWLDTKVSGGKLDALQKINIKNRVDLCKLSCDNYTWTNPGKFDASNMIVVNEGDDGPAGSILRLSGTTYRDNAYYLCGSDYYAGHGTDKYKFICVLRSGVTVTGSKMTFDKAPTADLKKKDFEVKPDDIIIDGGEDSEASSTSLREMLTEISKLDPSTVDLTKLPNKDNLLDLISIPVLLKLLELKYILTHAEKNKTILRIMGIDLDEEAEKAERAKNMDKVGETIKLNVDIGSEVRDLDKRVTKNFNRIETGGGGDCLFHTLRYLLTTAGKFKPTSDKTADMMTIRNAIVDHVETLGDGFVHLQQAIGDRLDFKKSNEGPERAALHADSGDETVKKLINVDGGVRTDGNKVLFNDRVVTVKDEHAKLGEGNVMKYVSQDMTRTYFTVMKEQGTFGTDFELGIAAALYDIMLCVITDEERCQYYIFNKPGNQVRGLDPGEYEKIKKNIWYIYNYTRTHYQYLDCIDAPAECPDPVKP